MKLAALALVLVSCGLAGAAEAKPWITPPVSVGSDAIATCVVHNVGTKPRTLAVEVRDATGAVLADVAGLTVQPGTFQAPVGQVVPTTGVVCVFEGLSRTLRGYVRISAGGTTHAMLPAAR